MENRSDLPLLASPVAIERVKEVVGAIDKLKKEIMIEGTHWGRIPGVEKDVLFLPGAEKLAFTFRLIPRYENVEKEKGPHLEVVSTCSLYTPEGAYLGASTGSCSTEESKYSKRSAERACPECGQAAIIQARDFKTKEVEGWVCWRKKGGCGAKFRVDDPAIAEQKVGRVDNPDLADVRNTVRKMAQKRAFVGATIKVLAASDIFTQDVEDMPPELLSNAAPQPVIKPVEPVIERPYRYDRKKVGEYIQDPEEQRQVWEFIRKNNNATKDQVYIYTSKPVVGWEPFLVPSPEAEKVEDVIGDDPLPWDDLSPKPEPAETPQETIERLKKKIQKKEKPIKEGNGNE